MGVPRMSRVAPITKLSGPRSDQGSPGSSVVRQVDLTLCAGDFAGDRGADFKLYRKKIQRKVRNEEHLRKRQAESQIYLMHYTSLPSRKRGRAHRPGAGAVERARAFGNGGAGGDHIVDQQNAPAG